MRFLKTVITGLCYFLIIETINLSAVASASDLHLAFESGLANTTYYETPRGHKLRYTHFKSPVEGPKDTVFFLQGRGTFLEFYEVLVGPLLERGLDVWMYDLSGQGGSTRLVNKESHDEETIRHMQHVDSFDFYLEDAYAFIEDVLLPHAEGRLFLGGYSTGGHVALRYLQRYSDAPFEAAFVISPLLALKLSIPNSILSDIFWSTSWLVNLESYVPGAGHTDPIFTMPFEENPYSGDESRFQEIRKLCIQYKPFMMGGVSLGWLKAASDSLNCLWQDHSIDAIQIPVLIATGGADGVVSVSYNELFANKLALSQHVYYLEGRHELFRETPEILTTWWTDFDAFLSDLGRNPYSSPH